ncbi:lipocalin-like domain-containing protein [Duganella aceris]|uniref:Lipocalin-like domain-containing protein n=1 Tax=Duganella aceris TaxID=2703883 RepID=A0ABX0FSA0_9BURK|nr:lipocalin-like domain-containing protein [Duganella aceris]NGZ87353.1 lipocalin-like domain-containing protein [Duganella aceris]
MKNLHLSTARRRLAGVVCGAVWAGSVAVLPAAAAPNAGPQLTGVWRLVRYVDTPDNAQPIYAFGEHPVGQFIFTPEGSFSINIMRNPPAPETATVDIDPDACIPAWYCSYFGTYRLAESGRQWIARVEGGNIPSYVGTNQTRSFELSGDRLRISESYEEGGRTVRAERVLERVQ